MEPVQKGLSEIIVKGRISSSRGCSLINKGLLTTNIKPANPYRNGALVPHRRHRNRKQSGNRKARDDQNQYLRKVTGALRAVSSRVLEKEVTTTDFW